MTENDNEKQHSLHHPLEDVLNLEIGSTPLGFEQSYDNLAAHQAPVVQAEGEVEEPKPMPDAKDEDDIQTDKRLDEVYNAAMQTFQTQTAYTEIIEPRYAARNAEVAAQFLTLALNAATAKAKVKVDRKRTNAAFIPFNNGNKTTANIIADRNDIMNMITVDTDVKEIK